MNHLSGLTTKLDGGATNRLADEERAVLLEFRTRYESALRSTKDNDASGWIWKVVQLLKALANTVENHYPELVDHVMLFNLPRAASAVFKVVKGFLDPVTANKIELYPGVPYARFAELLPDEIIAVEYGGKNRIEYPQTVFE
jgi:hypothetical protein